jgi:aldehyde dehydrogenase (NAD+)
MTAPQQIFAALGLDKKDIGGGDLEVRSPIDGTLIASVKTHSPKDADKIIAQSVKAFEVWRSVPAPRRGELVRLYGEILRENKEALGRLVTLECGKIFQEGLGEVQEMIDICDFAVGLSRQLYGLTIASERPGHKMFELWHPARPRGIISAFNFPDGRLGVERGPRGSSAATANLEALAEMAPLSALAVPAALR